MLKTITQKQIYRLYKYYDPDLSKRLRTAFSYEQPALTRILLDVANTQDVPKEEVIDRFTSLVYGIYYHLSNSQLKTVTPAALKQHSSIENFSKILDEQPYLICSIDNLIQYIRIEGNDELSGCFVDFICMMYYLLKRRHSLTYFLLG